MKSDKKKLKRSAKTPPRVKSASEKKKFLDIKTFSYFIPAPPDRTTSYREKEFDSVLFSILESGHELINVYTTTHGQKGTLLVCVLGSTHKKAKGILSLDKKHQLDNELRELSIEVLED